MEYMILIQKYYCHCVFISAMTARIKMKYEEMRRFCVPPVVLFPWAGSRSILENTSIALIIGASVDEFAGTSVILTLGPTTLTGYNVTTYHLAFVDFSCHRVPLPTVDVYINDPRIVWWRSFRLFCEVEYEISRLWGHLISREINGQDYRSGGVGWCDGLAHHRIRRFIFRYWKGGRIW